MVLSLILLAVGAVLTVVAAGMAHPALGVLVTALWCVGVAVALLPDRKGP